MTWVLCLTKWCIELEVKTHIKLISDAIKQVEKWYRIEFGRVLLPITTTIWYYQQGVNRGDVENANLPNYFHRLIKIKCHNQFSRGNPLTVQLGARKSCWSAMNTAVVVHHWRWEMGGTRNRYVSVRCFTRSCSQAPLILKMKLYDRNPPPIWVCSIISYFLLCLNIKYGFDNSSRLRRFCELHFWLQICPLSAAEVG